MTPDARIARRARSMLIRQINNVLCFFRNLNHVTKIQLLISYCYSLYGCVLWDMACSDIEMVCTAWRSGVRRVWGLPSRTHCSLVPLISGRLPLYDEIAKRMQLFICNCLTSDSQLVNSVARLCSLVWSHDVATWQEYVSLLSTVWVGC